MISNESRPFQIHDFNGPIMMAGMAHIFGPAMAALIF